MSTKNVKEFLADHMAITNLANRYTDAVNRRDWKILADVFAKDAVWDVGGPEAGPMNFLFTGRDQIVGGIGGLVDAMDVLVQTNHALTIHVSGDRATASSTLEEKGRPKGGAEGFRLMGMYSDDIVRDADGEWRFAKRVFRITYMEAPSMTGNVMKKFPAIA